MFIHPFPPALVCITARTLEDWQAGASRGPVVVIRPEREFDTGLLAHELTHVKHWWRYGLLAAALLAVVGYLIGNVTIAGATVPTIAFAPLGLLFNSLAYALWPEWRAVEEIDAYRVQARYYADDRLPLFAEFIATSYGLEITAAEALQRLREE